MMDMVTSLLACAGETTLWYAMMKTGLLEELKEGEAFITPAVRPDPCHVAVVTLGDLPARLVYDDDFGWLWYDGVNGPEVLIHADDPA